MNATGVKLADRVFSTNISGIRKVFDLAAKLENPINLSIGQPDFDVPDRVKDAAINAINDGKNSYTQTQGCPELRASLLDSFNGKYGPKELLITSAVSGGLNLAFLALLNPGDEILVPDPYFVMYKQLALMIGAKPVYYDTYPKWNVDIEGLEKIITPKTKAIVIGSPSNPSGAVYAAEELKAIAEVLDRHGIVAISDEIYKIFCYDQPFTSIAEYYDNTLVLGGYSKSHAMTGWRLGYAAGPEELVQAMTKFQQFTFVCAPSMAQYGGVEAMNTDMSEHVNAYRHKRDMIYSGLVDAGYEVEKPGGAFYILPKAPWGTDEEFVAKCIENSLLVIPGSVFSEKKTHFRISYAAKDETIERGIEVLGKLIKR
ncbi:MAG: aminotransferase class I/II-fold pyridoxal phosphate-dependent enzyme [Planctomycetes bacterium]|nr:aminotransferase class I/II-fold pyridoxal phosphate-dependent enzyme [Planctomycetota bacterium]